ncbi:MAG: glycosyl transferase family 2 [Pedobacter sp.]|nr:glycosyl transferase family 2 [Pedobacter sp.]
MKLSVIIPVLNEQDSIDHLISQLNSYFLQQQHYCTEVIFVNDGSTDRTAYKLKTGKHLYYSAKVISFSRNFGAHAALRAGIQYATGDYITFMYADLQDPVELVEMLLTEIETKDICWAFRNSTKVSKTEKVFSRVYAYLMRKYAVSNFPKKGFDIVMFSRKVQDYLNSNIESNSSVFIQILSLGYKQTAVTYNRNARLVGKSKWTLSKKIKLFIDSFVAFSFAPIRMVSIMGIIFFFLGIVWTGYIVFRKLVFNDLASGWPALISILMVGFGVTNISLGILAEYLWRTLDASRKRPPFVIDEVADIFTKSEHISEPKVHYQ